MRQSHFSPVIINDYNLSTRELAALEFQLGMPLDSGSYRVDPATGQWEKVAQSRARIMGNRNNPFDVSESCAGDFLKTLASPSDGINVIEGEGLLMANVFKIGNIKTNSPWSK